MQSNNRSGLALCCAAVLGLSACAQNPKDISPTYISPIIYQSYSCLQITQEAQRVSARASELTGTQQQKATNDAVATGVSLIVFWPAVFFVQGDRQTAAELGRLRGELDALQQASIAKNCGLKIETAPAPAAAAPARVTQ